MSIRNSLFSLSLLSGLLLTGCGGVGKAVKIMKGEGREPTVASFRAEDVQGTWVMVCTPHVQDKSKANITGKLVINGKTMTRDLMIWSDSACTKPLAHLVQTAVLTVDESTGGTSRAFHLDDLKTSETPVDATAAAEFNTAIRCGLQTWSVGSAQDLSATACNRLETAGGSEVNAVQVGLMDYHRSYLLLMHQEGNGFSTGLGDTYSLGDSDGK